LFTGASGEKAKGGKKRLFPSFPGGGRDSGHRGGGRGPRAGKKGGGPEWGWRGGGGAGGGGGNPGGAKGDPKGGGGPEIPGRCAGKRISSKKKKSSLRPTKGDKDPHPANGGPRGLSGGEPLNEAQG